MTPLSLAFEAIAPETKQNPEIDYPESDGKPMSENTEQYRWIVTIKENLEIVFADDPHVFIAGDLLWYPVRHSLKCMGPDVMVAIGRPKGKRGSYKQWLEADIAPQVVFEILSPSNKTRRGKQELQEKFEFYEVHKVQEYYIYDPDDLVLMGWRLSLGKFVAIAMQSEWISPLLKIRFEWQQGEQLVLYRPDGQRFLSSLELEQRAIVAERMAGIAQKRSEQESIRASMAEEKAEQEAIRANVAEEKAEQEAIRASMAEEKAEQEAIRANRLAALLKAMGVDPDQ